MPLDLGGKGKETGWLSKWAFQVGALAADAIGRQAIANGYFAATSAMRAKFANKFLTGAKIDDTTITEAQIADSAIERRCIDDGAVNADKLGALAVETAKIANDAVTKDKLDSAIQYFKVQRAANQVVKHWSVGDIAWTDIDLDTAWLTHGITLPPGAVAVVVRIGVNHPTEIAKFWVRTNGNTSRGYRDLIMNPPGVWVYMTVIVPLDPGNIIEYMLSNTGGAGGNCEMIMQGWIIQP